jgi:hypothetical protein
MPKKNAMSTDSFLKKYSDTLSFNLKLNLIDSILNLNLNKKIIKSLTTNKDYIEPIIMSYVFKLNQLKLAKKNEDSLDKFIDTLQTTVAMLELQLKNLPNVTELKAKLLSLEIALEKFNNNYAVIDFSEKEYYNNLFCIKLNLEKIFSIPVPDKGEELTKLLVNVVKSNTTPGDYVYYTDFTNLILAIQSNYDSACNKKAKYAVCSKSIQVPDADDFSISIKYSNSTDYILKRTLHTSLGWKIDFSTGLFISGLKDDNYIFKDTTVKYRRDTTAAANSLIDTTGKIVIQEDDGKNKLGLAVMLHAYPRISANYNFGITAGIAANTTGDFNFLLGLGIMLGSQKRIVLSGGCVWGKTNTKSNAISLGLNRQNPYDEQNLNKYSKPIFYTSADNKVPVVSGWHNSWFLGFSFNLSSK